MGWLFATLLSKMDFSFALLLATFEPLEIYQSYIPFWKAQECGNNAWEPQGRGCMFILRQTSLKMAILLHTVANWRFIMIIAVYSSAAQGYRICDKHDVCDLFYKKSVWFTEIKVNESAVQVARIFCKHDVCDLFIKKCVNYRNSYL